MDSTRTSARREFPRVKTASKWAALPVAALAVIFAGTAEAVDFKAIGSGDWATPGNWDPAGPPTSPSTTNNAFIGDNLSLEYGIGSTSLRSISIGSSFGGATPVGTLEVSGGILATTLNGISSISVGTSADSTGTLNITGGTVGALNGLNIAVGANSSGSTTVSGAGQIDVGALVVSGGNGSMGELTVNGGTVAVDGLFQIGRRITGTTTATYLQSAGDVSVVGTNYAQIGYADTNQTINATAEITGGTFEANVRLGRQVGSSGAGSASLTIGPNASVSGINQAWQISSTGTVVFELGTTAAFNAVDLTAASGEALNFTESGATIRVDGTNLVFSDNYAPVSLFVWLDGSAPTTTANVTFDYVGFDPLFIPELEWTSTSLQLNLTAVPEPSTVGLALAAAGMGIAILRRRRRSAQAA